MRRGVAFPFLVLGDKALRAGKWQLFTEEMVLIESGDHIPDWDYATTLRVHRTMELDFPLASAQLAIPQDDLRLSLILRVATGPGNIPHVIEVITYPISGPVSGPIVINQAIESSRLSRRLKLVTEVVLGESPSRSSQLSPTVRGSRLWGDEVDFRLEGQEPRFPMEVMSFREHFRDNIKAASLWYLHWNHSNLDADFRGSVRLYLNADRQDFVARV